MHQYGQEAAGRLLEPDSNKIAVRAFEAARAYKTRPVDLSVLTELRGLDSTTPGHDLDAGAIRLALTQLATAYFETTNDPNDSELALAASRSLTDYDTIPAWLCNYERGRTAYQVGKRLRDPALLEEAVHFYDQAAHLVAARSGRGRTLHRYRREAIALQRAFADEAIQHTKERGLLAAHFDIAIDAFPATASVRRKRGIRGRLTRWPEPIYCRPLGLNSQARFWWSGKVTPMTRRFGKLNERGRRLTGFMNAMQPDATTLVNQVSLTVWVGTNDADLATDDLRPQAVELYEWAERVSSWADVVTGRLPKFGFLIATRYIYGDLFLPNGGTQRLVLSADESGVTWEMRLRAGTDISRYELSYVLNRLVQHEVPIAIEMLQMAQYSLLDDKPRQAVIEAGTAAEAALTVLYDSYPSTAPREAPKQRPWTLGTLVRRAHRAGILPAGDTEESLNRELVAPRNGAVHRGHATRAQAVEAIETTRRLVEHTFGSGSDVVELDKRMRQLGPLLTPRPTVRAGFTFPTADET